MNIATDFLIAVAIFIAGLASGWKINSDRHDSIELKTYRNLDRELGDKRGQLDLLSGLYEKVKRERDEKQKPIDKAVENVASRPAYAVECLDDDGMRVANAAILGFFEDSTQPDTRMPATGNAGGR